MDKQTEFLRAHTHAHAVASSPDADREDYEEALEAAFAVDATLTGFSHIRSMIWLLQGRYHWGSEHISAYLTYLRRRFPEERDRCGVSVAPEALDLDMKELRQWTLPSEHRPVYETIVMYRDFAESCVKRSNRSNAACCAAAVLFVKTADEFLQIVRDDWDLRGGETGEERRIQDGGAPNEGESPGPTARGIDAAKDDDGKDIGTSETDKTSERDKRKNFRDYVIHPTLAREIGIDERFRRGMEDNSAEIVFSQEVYRPLWQVVERYDTLSSSDEKEKNVIIRFLRAYLGTHVARECTSLVDDLDEAVATVRNWRDEFIRTADGDAAEDRKIRGGGGGKGDKAVPDDVIFDALSKFRDDFTRLTGADPFEKVKQKSFFEGRQVTAQESNLEPEAESFARGNGGVVKVPGKENSRWSRGKANVANFFKKKPHPVDGGVVNGREPGPVYNPLSSNKKPLPSVSSITDSPIRKEMESKLLELKNSHDPTPNNVKPDVNINAELYFKLARLPDIYINDDELQRFVNSLEIQINRGRYAQTKLLIHRNRNAALDKIVKIIINEKKAIDVKDSVNILNVLEKFAIHENYKEIPKILNNNVNVSFTSRSSPSNTNGSNQTHGSNVDDAMNYVSNSNSSYSSSVSPSESSYLSSSGSLSSRSDNIPDNHILKSSGSKQHNHNNLAVSDYSSYYNSTNKVGDSRHGSIIGGGGSWFDVSPVSASLARASRFGDGVSLDDLRRKVRDLSRICKVTVEAQDARWKALKPRLAGWSKLTTTDDDRDTLSSVVHATFRAVEALLHTARLGVVDTEGEEKAASEEADPQNKKTTDSDAKPTEAKKRFLEEKQASSAADAKGEEREEEGLKGGHVSPVIMGVFASDIGLLLLFKVLRAAIQVLTLFAAQKVFQETYVRKVHVEKVDPPPLWNLLLIYLSFDATLQIILMTVAITASYTIGRGPSKSFVIDDMFLKLVLVDFLGTTLVTLVLGVVLAHFIRRKRFFLYKRSGMSTSGAYRDILALLIGVTFFIPFGVLLT